METIFVKVLKKLIKEQLSPLSASQHNKSQNFFFHDTKLSQQQQTIIDNLSDDITIYSGYKSDFEASQFLIDLVNKAREKIQPRREIHQKLKDEGETITCLNNLAHHISDLYKKIADLKKNFPLMYPYNLLDTVAKKNPLHIVYELAIYYLGVEVFDPNKTIDVETRAAKETKLAERIKILCEQIQENYNLEEQRSRALKMLNDLKRDNEDIVHNESSYVSTILSKLSFHGVALNIHTTSEGRLGRFIPNTILTIEEMTEAEFQPLGKRSSDEEKKISDNSVNM